MERVMSLASKRAVVIFSRSSCDMCHAVKSLFIGLGCNPAIHELDEDLAGKEMAMALEKLLGKKGAAAVPAVFIGGRLVGATDSIMSLHLKSNLVPMLREARAIWL